MPLPGRDRLPMRENAQDVAYLQLKDWIINGPLEAGETVRDVDVAEMLGVSRTPVREALIRLSQEGLIHIARGRSTRVAELAFDRAPHLYRVGGVLDAHAARCAIPLLTQRELDAMKAVLDEMETAQDVAQLQPLDEKFHDVYFEAAGNPVLRELMTQINQELRRLESRLA